MVVQGESQFNIGDPMGRNKWDTRYIICTKFNPPAPLGEQGLEREKVFMGSRRIWHERPYRSIPRKMRYSTYQTSEETKYRPRRKSPGGCDSCDPFECTTYPSPATCPDTSCCCPGQTDSGLLYTIRNGFQRIFSRNRKVGTMKGKVYNPCQLKWVEQSLERLEDDACYMEALIRQGFEGDCQVSCLSWRSTLSSLMEQAELTKCDLQSAYECYDPCLRDCGEYEMICCLLDRVTSLEGNLNDLWLQLECLEHESNYYYRGVVKCCKPNCRKPCCYRQPRRNCMPCSEPKNATCNRPCEIGCQKQCCIKPAGYEKFFKPVCDVNKQKICYPKQVCRRSNNNNCRPCLGRTSSVIPVGVMLVKL